MLRLALAVLAAGTLSTLAAASAAPVEKGLAATGTVLSYRCPLINIGTPSKPRWVKDPACGRS